MVLNDPQLERFHLLRPLIHLVSGCAIVSIEILGQYNLISPTSNSSSFSSCNINWALLVSVI